MSDNTRNESAQPEPPPTFFCRVRDAFHVFARQSSNVLGNAWAFIAAIVIIVVWGCTGPMFHFSDTWQLIINTGTTIVTFLMVFLIQNTQNRDAWAIRLKLDEIIKSIDQAQNEMIDIEHRRTMKCRNSPTSTRRYGRNAITAAAGANKRLKGFDNEPWEGLELGYRSKFTDCYTAMLADSTMSAWSPSADVQTDLTGKGKAQSCRGWKCRTSTPFQRRKPAVQARGFLFSKAKPLLFRLFSLSKSGAIRISACSAQYVAALIGKVPGLPGTRREPGDRPRPFCTCLG
jgi:low affinity Fe/Cu permease